MMTAIRRLDQVRALANPLRLRILDALTGIARTPKQVADRLRLKPTGLYHHVRVLEKAGLIRQTETRKKRGTLETYYRAARDEVRVDPAVFGKRRRGVAGVVTGVLDAAQDDVGRMRSPADPVLALRLRMPVVPSRLKMLEALLQKWAAAASRDGAREYALTLVACPQAAAHRSKESRRTKR